MEELTRLMKTPQLTVAKNFTKEIKWESVIYELCRSSNPKCTDLHSNCST